MEEQGQKRRGASKTSPYKTIPLQNHLLKDILLVLFLVFQSIVSTDSQWAPLSVNLQKVMG